MKKIQRQRLLWRIPLVATILAAILWGMQSSVVFAVTVFGVAFGLVIGAIIMLFARYGEVGYRVPGLGLLDWIVGKS